MELFYFACNTFLCNTNCNAMWVFLPFLTIRKISNEPLMHSYLSLMDSQSIASCSFSLKSLTVSSKSSISSIVHSKFPSSPILIFFFRCLRHNHSTAQHYKKQQRKFLLQASNMSSIFLYYKLIPNIPIFYFHFSCKILLIWD